MNRDVFSFEDNSLAWHTIGQGKPLLMLHGWGSSSKALHPLALKLQKIRTCYLLDMPGFGESPEPNASWSVDDYADIIEAFIKKTFPEDGIDLLAHSFGARVAIKLLGRKSVKEKIDKVIFTGAAGLKPKRKPNYYIKKYTAKTLKLPFYLLPGTWREKGLNRLRKTSVWKMLGSSDYQQLSGVMRETFVKTVTEYLDRDITRIEQEILLLWGENDKATPLEQGKRMESGFQQSTLIVIENAGHYAFLDRPAHFASIVKAYLDPKR